MRVELMTESVMASPPEMAVFSQERIFADTPVDVSMLPPPLYRHVETTVMESDVTIVGIAVCGVVVIVLVVFVVVQRTYWRRIPKYSMAASSENSPAHVVHSSSAQSSQPSSPGPQVHVDMDIPLTGGNNAKRKNSSGQRAVSRGSSVSSTCSAGLKKIRSKTDNAAGGGVNDAAGAAGGSPKPNARDYSPMVSPYSANASPEDHVHDTNFFRASPILRQVAPRSPKVHPHRVKVSPGTPGSPQASPIMTKHEMLTRKRQERKLSTPAGEGAGNGDREVTGE
nr:hypothetical protein BaRGS_026038 [Batillaria attramentaria]